MKNAFYFGDNLNILGEYIPDESVDLVYLDPPFNSNASYNLLFKSPDKTRWADAQIATFEDTWKWGDPAEETFAMLEMRPGRVGDVLGALRRILGENDMLAYLVMMAARLAELDRVLKPTGSLYLHCDPTASHYLKVVMDAIFGVGLFQNEIVWQRNTGKSLMKRRLPNTHDLLLAYRKSDDATWNDDAIYVPYDPDNLPEKTAQKYCNIDPDGRRYTLGDLLNPNKNRPNLDYEFLGVRRVWRWTKDRMQAAYEAGLIHQSAPGKVPRLKRYLDEMKGLPLTDVWTDILPLNSQARERLGYPTQKPLALLERIIAMSSNEGDVVLDPFCGCGTTLHAAHAMGRRWIGIDVAIQAMSVVGDRLRTHFPAIDYDVFGIPRSIDGALYLAENHPFKFEEWAVTRIGGMHSGKYRGDRGIDGIFYFLTGNDQKSRGIISVKGGRNLNPGMIRDLVGTLDRERRETRDPDAIAVFVCAHEPSRGMLNEARQAGTIETATGPFPAVQILTVREIFEGAAIRVPALFDSVAAAAAGRQRGRSASGFVDPRELARQRAMLFTFDGTGPSVAAARPEADRPMPAQLRMAV
ncbi:Type III restriction-modification system methylation subunit [Rhodovulum sp. P5]|uniref:site-specific DNA-methyltransferase n=1 Tax=Rhodovulum sp. P5 TaxID=1564506 RepID=UPI0009C38290|nr:site-specific DNA-methyltransferase [Rhodovulum sp. P5]ARE40875.1 Type III restriction-modification system methylation subunit [Rhodovulum sp. P5]